MGTVLEGDILWATGTLPHALPDIMLGNLEMAPRILHSKTIGVGVMITEGRGGELREDGRYYKQFTKEITKLARGEELPGNSFSTPAARIFLR